MGSKPRYRITTHQAHWLPALVVGGLLIAPFHATGSTPQCSRQDEEAADNQITELNQKMTTERGFWTALHALFRRFSGCDDGYIAEGYSDLVVKGLAQRWESVDELVKIAHRDTAFKKFVLRHIDETTDPADLELIRRNAGSKCERRYRDFCKQVAEEAAAALRGQPNHW